MPEPAAPSVPGDDPVVTASNWLNAHSFCDLNCTENHRIAHCTVTGLHAVAATARIAAAEYKRERDQARDRIGSAAAQLRALADWSSVPPADLLRQLADRLEAQS